MAKRCLVLGVVLSACGSPQSSPAPESVETASKVEPETEVQPPAQTLVSPEAVLASKGGTFVDARYDERSGIRPEEFHLTPGGRYLWIEAAIVTAKPTVANRGPGYLRRGEWRVEDLTLVLDEQEQVIHRDGKDVHEKAVLTRKLAIGVCKSKAQGCVTFDGGGFILDPKRAPEKEGDLLWPDRFENPKK